MSFPCLCGTEYGGKVTVNQSTEEVDYSKNYKFIKYKPDMATKQGLNERKNIILIVLESFSSYQSLYFGGDFNNMPNMDKIAKENVSFNNYYSNGYNSDSSIFSINTGIPRIHSVKSMIDDSNYIHALPKTLIENGYNTNIMYSAENIGSIDDVNKKSGFEHFIDGKDPFYNKCERLTFNSVPDADLFNNALRLVNIWGASKTPFFTMIMTTTSHGPYTMPKSHINSFEETIRYTDIAVAAFISQLEKRQYFKNGIVVITADHRAMLPLTKNEYDKYGDRAIAKVPLVIIDKSLKSRKISNMLSHSSLSAIIKYLVLRRYDDYDYQVNPLVDISKDENVFYQRFGPSDEIFVFTKDRDYSIILDGDETRVKDATGDKLDAFLKLITWFRKKDQVLNRMAVIDGNR